MTLPGYEENEHFARLHSMLFLRLPHGLVNVEHLLSAMLRLSEAGYISANDTAFAGLHRLAVTFDATGELPTVKKEATP